MDSLVDEYWDLAHAEGAEGRTHDTPQGDAQRVLSAIRKEILAIERAAFASGAAAATGLLTREVERLRPHYQSNTGTDQARRQMLDHFGKFADSALAASAGGQQTGDRPAT